MSTWQWAKRAPAERLTLPACLLLPPAAEILHHASVSGADTGLGSAAAAALLGMRASHRTRDRQKARRHGRHVFYGLTTVGSWLAVATAEGPLAGPHHALLWTWGAGSLGGYLWLRRHEAVAAARDWRNRKDAWLSIRHQWGLDGSFLLHHEETRLGERYRVDVTETGKLASQIVHGSLAERIAQQRKLPRTRVQVHEAQLAGEIEISIRDRDPWAHPITHPVLAEEPEIRLPVPCTIRDHPVTGQDPETGRVMTIPLWDEDGAKRVLVVAITRGGKTVLLNCIRERVTAAADALLVNINLSKALEDKQWAPACHLTAITRQQAGRALKILRVICAIIEWRSQQPRASAVFQPSPADPLIVLTLDEIDVLAAIPAARPLLKYIFSKGGSEGVAAVMCGQRGTAEWIGGSDTRSQADVFAISQVSRRGEAMHAAGDLGLTMPDMASYGEGHKGVWAVAELGGDIQTGRTFLLKEPGDLARLAAERAWGQPDLPPALREFLGEAYEYLLGTDVFAQWAREQDGTTIPRSPVTAHPRPDMPSAAEGSGQQPAVAVLDAEDKLAALDAEAEDALDDDLRKRWRATGEKIESARQALAEAGHAEPDDTPAEERFALAESEWLKLGAKTPISDDQRRGLTALLARGTTIPEVAEALGVSKWNARCLIERLRSENLVRKEGDRRTSRWFLAETPRDTDSGDGS